MVPKSIHDTYHVDDEYKQVQCISNALVCLEFEKDLREESNIIEF